jgi:hypothetical protein
MRHASNRSLVIVVAKLKRVVCEQGVRISQRKRDIVFMRLCELMSYMQGDANRRFLFSHLSMPQVLILRSQVETDIRRRRNMR